ncbi:MAG: ParB/RepB/Spo0J family partition protein [Oscillospiraceae bacterium]|jgi:ParB family chromosome partitioning protein
MALRRKQGIWETARVLFLPVEQIVPNPAQPRKKFSPQGLDELAESIQEHGILQPLTVRRRGSGYELISGERRLRSAKQAGLREVPCLIAGVDEEESSLLALVENLQRRDLNFMEEAEAIARLIQLYGFSQEEAAQKIGKSQSAVANKLRLLRLSPGVIQTLQAHRLTERHARALLRLEKDDMQMDALEHITGHGLNVAQTEAYIESVLAGPEEPPAVLPAKTRKRNTFVIKDVRFFLNSITRGMRMMKNAGVDAEYGKQETEEDILLTIRIPKRGPAK